MSGWMLLSVVVVALCVGLGEGLICNQCDALCTDLIRKNVSCAAGEVCGTKKKFKGEVLSITAESCVNKDRCGKTEQEPGDLFSYSVNITCCETDKCNGGTTAQLSLLAGLGAILVLCLSA